MVGTFRESMPGLQPRARSILPGFGRYAQASGATTLFSMCQQLSAGLGIAFGAIALGVAERFTVHAGQPGIADFRIAFGLMAVLGLLALLDAMGLPRDAGSRVSGHLPRMLAARQE
jgi:hypothetical protein